MTPLTPERWPRIQALFATLVDAAEGERAQALAAAAAEDPELARIVDGMLAQQAPQHRLQSAIAGVASTLEPGGAAPPARFGRYRTVGEIGRGGMGVVYEGVSDDEFARRVAIKVAPLARLGAAADARFRLEGQILSSLDHPHIARFLDGGTQDGLPYFVMEFVAGVPITSYVAARALPFAERLRLIQRLCGALHYAHQRLVVHRDLKPSNILVTGDGTPKLLDFGVAKLLDPIDAAQPTLGALAWTPDYASPEQVTGALIGTPSDIYSLGLVFYEVLTGARAQVADTTAPLAISRAVCDTVPPRPSEKVAAAGDAALARRLRGDLDTIVMTALHKDPARRYVSAAAVADDIERYLTGKPVEAHPSSLWYRTRKTLARHRGTAVAASLLTVAVSAGLVSTAYQARRADRRFQQVRALANEFVFGMHDRIATLPGATEARRALVQTALTYLENLREDAGDDPALARELAAAYAKVARVQGHPLEANLGDPVAAVASFARARALLEPLDASGDRDARLALAHLELQVASLQRGQGDTAGADRGLTRALDLAERLRAANPRDEGALEVIGEGHADLVRAALDRRDHAAVAAAAQRSLDAAAALLALRPGDAKRQDNVATANGAVARAHLMRGELEASAASFARAVEIREALLQAAPENTQWRRGLVVALGNLSDVLASRLGENIGDVEGAVRALSRAVAICRDMVASDPQDRRAVFDLVNALMRLGGLLADAPERRSDAVGLLEEAHRLNTALIAAEPTSSRYGFLQLMLDRKLGQVYRLTERSAPAEALLRRVRRDAAAYVAGDAGAAAHLVMTLAGVELALLLAERQNHDALTVAATVEKEVAAGLEPPVAEAQAHADLGRAFLLLAQHAPRPARGGEAGHPAHLALAHFQNSAALWQRVALPPQLTAQRDRALTELAANRAAAASLVSR